MECTNCHQQVPDSAKVCGYCGHRLKAVAPAVQPVQAPPPASFAASGQPPLAVPKKGGFPGWAWGLIIGGFTIVGLAFAAIIIISKLPPIPSVRVPTDPPQSSNPLIITSTQTSEATYTPSTQFNPQQQDPTRTYTPTFTPTATQPPQAYDPLSVLANYTVIRTEGFDSLTDNWYFNNSTDKTVYIYDSTNPGLAIDARAGYMIELNGNRQDYGILPGQAYLIAFYSRDNAAFDAFIVYPGGQPDTASYRRLGLGYSDNHLYKNFWIGANSLPADDVTGPLAISDGNWYSMLMAYDKQGNLLFYVWQTDNPANSTNRISYGGGIDNLFWGLVIQVGRGVLFIDRIQILSFDGFQ
jgi:hypothetical protein